MSLNYADGSYEKELYDDVQTIKDRTLTFSELLRELDENYGHYFDNSETQLIVDIYRDWVDLDGIAAREDNVLNLEQSAEDWTIGYRKAVADLILRRGMVVALVQDYGWTDSSDYDVVNEAYKNDEILGVFNVKETEWNEFQDTFTGFTVSHGFSMDVILKNGYSREVRYQGTLQSIMSDVLK